MANYIEQSNIITVLACTCGNSTACCEACCSPLLYLASLLPPPPPPPPNKKLTPGGSLLSILKTLNTLINMKEVRNEVHVNQGVIATHGPRLSSG